MNKFMKKLMAVVMMAVMMTSLLAGCDKEEPADGPAEVITHTITVATEGGVAMEKLDIQVYEDNTKADLVAVGKTDENGTYSFEAPKSDKYAVYIDGIPQGYPVQEYYSFTDGKINLSLKAELIPMDKVDAKNFKLKLGAVMADLTVTVDGKAVKISDLLKEKKAVVVNFWYINCDPCKTEFPYLQEAYAEYADKLEVLAVNPYDGDDKSVADFKADNNYTFPMSKADEIWNDILVAANKAFPTTLVIDRYGTIAFMHTGSVPNADNFKQLFGYFTADDYKQTTIRNIEDILVKPSGGDGSQAYPFEPIGMEYTAEVPAGKEFYYQMYRVDGMRLEIADPNAYVVYGGQKYEAKDGKVSLMLSSPDVHAPVVFAIGNKSAENKKFQVTVSFLPGSLGAPFSMNLGKVDIAMPAGQEGGYYYLYEATENGDFTLKCDSVTKGVNFDFSLYNLNSYAFRMYGEEGSDNTLSIAMNKGDTVQVMITTLTNDKNEYPAADFKFTASFKAGAGTGIDPNAKIEYVVNVKDKEGNPVKGATLTFKNNETGATETATSDAGGVAKLQLVRTGYTVTITAPAGYESDATEYVADALAPLDIVLTKVKVEDKTYTITVQDESGKAIANAGVTVGNEFKKTDSKGVANFTLPAGTYTASANMDGYTMSGTYKVTADKTAVTIKMKKDVVEIPKVSYTVSVVEYDGKAITSGATVQFLQGTAVVAEIKVNNSGKAVAQLKEGTYSARISDGKYMAEAVAFGKNTSIKLTAYAVVDKTSINEWCDNVVVNIGIGEFYATLDSEHNYFTFTPDKDGVYRVSVKDNAAKVAFAGASEYYMPALFDDSYKEYYEYEILEDQVGHAPCIFSIKGTKSVVIIIERVGNIVNDEKVYTEYTGKKDPVAGSFTVPTTGKQTWVDVTASAFTYVLGDDGYYHKDNKNGPIIYVSIGAEKPVPSGQSTCTKIDTPFKHQSIYDVIHNPGGFMSHERLEDYANLMHKYIAAADQKTGVYPLTADLIHMFKYGGEGKGWFKLGDEGGNMEYVFASEISANKTLNKDLLWMLECCYWE